MNSKPRLIKKCTRKIIVAGNPSEFSEKGAEMFCKAATRSIREKGWFAAAISGGSTPRPIHRKLGLEPYRSGIPWDRIHLFWVDERMVNPSDASSNYGTAYLDFLKHIPIPVDHIHSMPVSGPMKTRARRYELELRRFKEDFCEGALLFDFVFLGIGADGHVASLFPEMKTTLLPGFLTVLVHGGYPNLWRLSLTFEAINAAQRVCFLVSGREKAHIVAQVTQNRIEDIPAQKIFPVGGDIVYLLDAKAASLLPIKAHEAKPTLEETG